MSLPVQIVDPTRWPSWDEMLLRTPGSSFFHSSAWARVLSESYGYTPLYFTVMEGERLRALVPVMEVKSFLTGKRGVSLPFTDYCEPIMDAGIPHQELLDHILENGRKRGWKHVELRGGKDRLADAETSKTFLGHNLGMNRGEGEIFSGFRESTRRNIKKAISQGVAVQISDQVEAIKEFCRLNRMTRKQHGLPPQPYHFFQNICDHVIFKGLGFIALASHQGRNIAGSVFFHFGGKGIYKYGASDKKYQDLRANNLVMWEAIKWFGGRGFKSFCFGRTEAENKGLRQFKAGWGAEESEIRYFKYDLRKEAFVAGKPKGEPAYTAIFRATPAPVLNAVGSLLYRHMG